MEEKLENERIIQINLKTIKKSGDKNNKINIGTDKVVLLGLNSNQIYTENDYVLVKYVEYYRNLFYDKKIKLNNSEIWLVMLDSRNFKELYDTTGYLLNDEKRDKCIRKVIDMCNDEFTFEKKLEKIINENNIKFIPLTDDNMFRKFFLNNLEILKEFVISQLEQELNPDDFYIETEETYKEELTPEKTIKILLKKDKSISINLYLKTNSKKYNNLNLNNFYIIQINT